MQALPRCLNQAPGLYVHVPFCLRKCSYCAFYSDPAALDDALVDAFIECVSIETRELVQPFEPFGQFDSVYIGGGTPSLLAPERLARLVENIRQNAPISTDAEVTIELNPADVSRGKALQLQSLGINRVSLGVQALDDEVLRILGRRHTATEALQAFDVLRTVGFSNIAVDLIWGIPQVDSARTMESIREMVACKPEHICCYELTIEPDTPFGLDVKAGKIKPIDDDLLADEALAIWQVLHQARYDHYEVSSFARCTETRSRHNAKYWNHTPYLGLGPSAHSFDGIRRWANVSSVQGYCDGVFNGNRRLSMNETLCETELISEEIAVGMRTSNGVDVNIVSASALQELFQQGFVYVREGRVIPTQMGMLVADAVALRLDRDGPTHHAATSSSGNASSHQPQQLHPSQHDW